VRRRRVQVFDGLKQHSHATLPGQIGRADELDNLVGDLLWRDISYSFCTWFTLGDSRRCPSGTSTSCDISLPRMALIQLTSKSDALRPPQPTSP
jgi:hypothetical protein